MNPIRSRSLGLVAAEAGFALKAEDAVMATAVTAAVFLINVRRETFDGSMIFFPAIVARCANCRGRCAAEVAN
jgi:hypothetical protein